MVDFHDCTYCSVSFQNISVCNVSALYVLLVLTLTWYMNVNVVLTWGACLIRAQLMTLTRAHVWIHRVVVEMILCILHVGQIDNVNAVLVLWLNSMKSYRIAYSAKAKIWGFQIPLFLLLIQQKIRVKWIHQNADPRKCVGAKHIYYSCDPSFSNKSAFYICPNVSTNTLLVEVEVMDCDMCPS